MNSVNKMATYFLGGKTGTWKVQNLTIITGESLPLVSYIDVQSPITHVRTEAEWTLAGVSGHARYTNRNEKENLSPIQAPLGRTESIYAALIPIKKNAEWWNLSQDERRAIFEDQSKHITRSTKYLPAIARKLYHSRDLDQPFDFLTWFEFAPKHEDDFNELLLELRSSAEWNFVSREIDMRLVKSEFQ